ncbi:unnamed protein product [Owenia fusiformis]|uniref:Chitin synthase n=1 Tax=Owenia fusiformis TaxID=6347 RepID=A0A8S4P3R8_OWEFU|nr:unnamed protein product [Owenia fusiformis]
MVTSRNDFRDEERVESAIYETLPGTEGTNRVHVHVTKDRMKDIMDDANQASIRKKRSPNIMIQRIIDTNASVAIVIGAMVIIYILNIKLLTISMALPLSWVLTACGVVTLTHYIFEMLFALVNKYKMDKLGRKVLGKQRASFRCNGKVALQIVGYREDPDYFRNCIISARDCYGPIYVLCVVVDGHEEQDAYMAETITEVFGHENTMHIILDDIAANIDDGKWKKEVVKPVSEYLGDGSEYTGKIRPYGGKQGFKVLTIRQLHEGKRSAMHCAMRLLIDLGIDYIMMTDSDTRLGPNSLAHMINLLESDNNIGAVTGDIEIFNANKSPVSFLSAVRYWFAFNMERAAQSLFGVVWCVSGPLGLYRARDIRRVLHDWYYSPCAYGEDRHLTIRILSLGRTVKYTHLAKCTTESPTNLIRWIVQQTRWTKSFYSELGFNLLWTFRINFYLTWVLLYEVVYPFFVTATIVIVLFSSCPISVATLVVLMVSICAFRALVATVISKKPRLLFYFMFSFLYILFLIPTKIVAVMCLWDTRWGTSNRLFVSNGNPVHLIPVFLWFCVLVIGIILNENLFFGLINYI